MGIAIEFLGSIGRVGGRAHHVGTKVKLTSAPATYPKFRQDYVTTCLQRRRAHLQLYSCCLPCRPIPHLPLRCRQTLGSEDAMTPTSPCNTCLTLLRPVQNPDDALKNLPPPKEPSSPTLKKLAYMFIRISVLSTGINVCIADRAGFGRASRRSRKVRLWEGALGAALQRSPWPPHAELRDTRALGLRCARLNGSNKGHTGLLPLSASSVSRDLSSIPVLAEHTLQET